MRLAYGIGTARLSKKTIMSKAKAFLALAFLFGTVPVVLAQAPTQLQYSRVVDLTLPIESNMAVIPSARLHAANPSRVSVVSAMTDAQKELLQSEGLTLSGNMEINGRSMISLLSILTHRHSHR